MSVNLSIQNNVKAIVTILILALLLFASATFFTKPQYNSFATQLSAKQAVQQDLNTIDKQIGEIDVMDKAIDNLAPADVEKLRKALPVNEDLEEFLINMHKLAQLSNLIILNLDVHPTTASVNPDPNSNLPVDLNMSQITLSVRGSYPNIMVFVDSLERYARLIDVSSLTINNIGKSSSVPSGDQVLQADIGAKVYSLKPIPDVPVFPYGRVIDASLFESPQFKDLQVQTVTLPNVNTNLTNPFAP